MADRPDPVAEMDATYSRLVTIGQRLLPALDPIRGFVKPDTLAAFRGLIVALELAKSLLKRDVAKARARAGKG